MGGLSAIQCADVMPIGERHFVPADRRHWNEYQKMCEEGCVHHDGQSYSMKDVIRVVVIRSDTPEEVLAAYMNAKNTDSQRAWEVNDVDVLYQAEAARGSAS